MNFLEELDAVFFATICVTLFGHSLLFVGLTAYQAALNRVSFEAIDRFLVTLRFPPKIIFKLFTQGNPKPFLRLAANGAVGCETLMFIVMGCICLLPFSAISFLGIFSGITKSNLARIVINSILIIWVIGGAMYAYYLGWRLKEIHLGNIPAEKPKRKHS